MRVHGKKGKEFTAEDWKGIRDTRYRCPNCEQFVKIGWKFCPHCAQAIEFPTVTFSEYIPGERQKTFLNWK